MAVLIMPLPLDLLSLRPASQSSSHHPPTAAAILSLHPKAHAFTRRAPRWSSGSPAWLYPARKKNAPIPGDERVLETPGRSDQKLAVAAATTFLRQGFSTAIASSEARIFAPAAMMKTRSHVPDDCCM